MWWLPKATPGRSFAKTGVFPQYKNLNTVTEDRGPAAPVTGTFLYVETVGREVMSRWATATFSQLLQ